MRKRAALTAVVTALILAAGCARPIRVRVAAGGSKDDAALAAAVGWLVNELPLALTLVEVDGVPASDQLLNLILLGAAQAQATGNPDGNYALRHAPLNIHATRPVWRSRDAATVALQYASGEEPLVGCRVSVQLTEPRGTTWLVKNSECPRVPTPAR